VSGDLLERGCAHRVRRGERRGVAGGVRRRIDVEDSIGERALGVGDGLRPGLGQDRRGEQDEKGDDRGASTSRARAELQHASGSGHSGMKSLVHRHRSSRN
jgi:hypothetical protein